MNRSGCKTLLVVSIGCAATVALASAPALAQQKQKISYAVSASDTKYTQRNTLEVGDTAGHELSMYEIHRAFPVANAPAVNGVKLKEQWTRGYGDYVDRAGLSINYNVYVLENGDRIFGTTQTMGRADSSGKRSTISVGKLTGGTGKFVAIRGTVRSSGASDGKTGFNETQTEIEYWMAN